MGYSDGIISRPVVNDINGDMQQALGSTSTDLGTLCSFIDINKNARYKPVRYNSTDEITEVIRSSVHYGLSPTYISKLLVASYGYEAFVAYTEAACLAEIVSWPYNPPRGSAYNEPYRQLDFEGYNRNAKPADGDWVGVSYTYSRVATFRNAVVTPSGSRAGKNLVLTPNTDLGIYSSFSVRFGAVGSSGSESAGNWGSVTDREIPITYITGSLTESNMDWRLAIAVWLPSNAKWTFFPARANLKDSSISTSSQKNLFPDFATNPQGWELIDAEIKAGASQFDCVPIIVSDIDYMSPTGSTKFYPRFVSGVSAAYCMPSGQKAFVLMITDIVKWWLRLVYNPTSEGLRSATIYNDDPSNQHVIDYDLVIRLRRTGAITSSTHFTITLAAGSSHTTQTMPDNSTVLGYVENLKQDGKSQGEY